MPWPVPPDSFSHGYAVPAPSKRELFDRVIFRLSNQSYGRGFFFRSVVGARIARLLFMQNPGFAHFLLHDKIRPARRKADSNYL